MRRNLLALLTAVALSAAMAAPVAAITNGRPDGAAHPYVGLIVFQTADGSAHFCSGTLLSPTVVLTAGHCTAGIVEPRVWFDASPDIGQAGFSGVPYPYPGFVAPAGAGRPGYQFADVGLILLEEPVPTTAVATYAGLPAAGAVDRLPNKAGIDFVGYGRQYKARQSGPPQARWSGDIARNAARGELVSGSFEGSANTMRASTNPGGGSGGTCFGDSGGPDLLAGTSTVLAVNSFFTNPNCAGVGYGTRVDVADRLAWIRSFMK